MAATWQLHHDNVPSHTASGSSWPSTARQRCPGLANDIFNTFFNFFTNLIALFSGQTPYENAHRRIHYKFFTERGTTCVRFLFPVLCTRRVCFVFFELYGYLVEKTNHQICVTIEINYRWRDTRWRLRTARSYTADRSHTIAARTPS